ncbi:MAG: polysaccharide deacetylase family protein [Candidatus Aegiribacteria sp.]|nr:polysaccharide deacetylase family protein [Candidatus Aegiribacteria sp.]
MKKLHLTVHDVSPAHEGKIRQIHSTLTQLGVVRYSMLVVPDYHGKWPLDEFPEFCGWLEQLAENGVEMVLHGYRHEGSDAGLGITDKIRSALFTRNEGEFLGLDEKNAEKLLETGREVLKRVLGIEVQGFVAPAWFNSRGTIAALKKSGFTFTENRLRIWNPETGRTILRMPVVNYAGGGLLKRTLAAFWVRVSGIILSRSGTVRFAIHPGDFEVDAVKKAVRKRLEIFLRRRESIIFKDIKPAP